jgi:hypothetical protein
MYKGAYREDELVTNRSAVLLCGGSEKDKRLWAEEALASLGGAQLVSVKGPQELSLALALKDAVVLVEDVGALSFSAQAQIVQCLHRQEERPKLILGLKQAADQARAQGLLREDLHFRLSIAKVDLAQSRVLESARKRPAPKAAKPARKK